MKFDKNKSLSRNLVLERKQADNEARTVPASLSSDVVLDRGYYKETLSHEKGAIDLTRSIDGLPLLFNHDQSKPIGIIQGITNKDGKLRGVLHFSNNELAVSVFRDIQEGFLKDISVSYRVNDYEERNDDEMYVKNWTILEGSVVTVPADQSVGINRSFNDKEGDKMPDKKEGKQDDFNAGEFVASQNSARKEGEKDATEKRKVINTEIVGMFTGFRGTEFDALKDKALTEVWGIEATRKALLSLVSEGVKPVNTETKTEDKKAFGEGARTIDSETDKVSRGIEDSLLVKTGIITDREEVRKIQAGGFVGLTATEMAREFLRAHNVETKGLGRDGVIKRAFMSRANILAHSTTDFASILENVAAKALMVGYTEAPETWMQWCKIGSVSDFKEASRVALSAFSDLDEIKESGDYTEGTFSDVKETLAALTYGKLFNISRQALVNDDLSALSAIPMGMGRAAARKVGDLVYNVLINNPTMAQDSTALFHTDHGNFIAGGSGAAPSVATVNAARTAMATQTDPSGNAVLNVMPAFMLVPHALLGTASALAEGQYDPEGTAGTLTPNTVRNTFKPIAEARLDVNDPAAWFMAANSNMADTIEVAFLDGNQEPYLEQQEGWSSDGVSYKVRIDAVAGAIDFRGLYMNDGN